MKDTRERLSHLTLALHWSIAALIICLMAVGIYMAENKVYSLYPVHKSLGALVFVLALARVLWRLVNGMPQPLTAQRNWQTTLASAVHWVLLIGTVLFPLSGLMMSVMGGHGLQFFGLEIIASNPNPDMPGRNLPLNADLAKLGRQIHSLLIPVMGAAIALHIAGAIKQQMAGTGIVPRMLGRKV